MQLNKMKLALLCVSLALIACEKTDVRQSSELDGSRILAVSTLPHEIDLSTPPTGLVVDVVDYVEEESAVYNWTLCISAGAITRFECLPDTVQLEGTSDTPTWEIPFDLSAFANSGEVSLDTDFSDWSADPCPNHELLACDEALLCPIGSFCVQDACRSLTELYPIEFVVKVEPVYEGSEGILAAMEIPTFVGSSQNRVIALESATVGDTVIDSLDHLCASEVQVGGSAVELELSAVMRSDSIDEYQVLADNICDTVSETSSGIVSWYATDGELERPLSDLDDPSNTLDLDEGSDPITLFIVARDGRGTSDAACITILRE